ncbi:hypothetical protein E2C01_011365 [Portunus trituberculatus]|uniref:Uncharacterized protein n=1 Tax=Portunus trituberculatus TaxID=210409 RepID=A0A5B7DB78_PORTR|nr:hypothetical protein [Portunus trituberculatus]
MFTPAASLTPVDDGIRSSRYFFCEPVLGDSLKKEKLRKLNLDIETRRSQLLRKRVQSLLNTCLRPSSAILKAPHVHLFLATRGCCKVEHWRRYGRRDGRLGDPGPRGGGAGRREGDAVCCLSKHRRQAAVESAPAAGRQAGVPEGAGVGVSSLTG